MGDGGTGQQGEGGCQYKSGGWGVLGSKERVGDHIIVGDGSKERVGGV